jgi:hypothetical protein
MRSRRRGRVCAKKLDEVLWRVRKDYIEVDLNETNKNACSVYVQFQKDLERKVRRRRRT